MFHQLYIWKPFADEAAPFLEVAKTSNSSSKFRDKISQIWEYGCGSWISKFQNIQKHYKFWYFCIIYKDILNLIFPFLEWPRGLEGS